MNIAAFTPESAVALSVELANCHDKAIFEFGRLRLLRWISKWTKWTEWLLVLAEQRSR